MLILLLSRPHLVLGTIYATLEATYFADKNFDEPHGLDNQANAYKHALWNILIAYYVQWAFKVPERAVAWAKKITDLHEVCFKNEPDATNMDLRNNQIGRNIYLDLYQQHAGLPPKKLLLDTLWQERHKLKTLTT